MLTDLPFENSASGSLCYGVSTTDPWSEALAVLAQKLSSQNFDLWFRPIQCLRVEGRCLHLVAPNQFIKEWFETHYQQVVLDVIKQIHGRDYSVAWQIEERASNEQADGEPSDSVSNGGFSEPAPAAKKHKTGPAPGKKTGTSARRAGKNGKPLSNSDMGEESQDLLSRNTFDSFVVGPSNQLAAAACQAVAESPGGKYNPLFLYGCVGLGKTHLLHAVGHKLRSQHPDWNVVYLKAETFMNEYIKEVRSGRIEEFRAKYRNQTDVLLMDDIQYLSGKERTQDEFFHTFNALFETHRQIVVTADKYPHEIPDLEDRIRSRFQWGLIADIQPPDLETRVAILKKKAELDSIDLPDDVALFLAANIKSNVREMEGLLIRAAACASLEQRPITVEYVQDTLRNFLGQQATYLNVEAVQREVANYFGVKTTDLLSSSRLPQVARPRQVAMYLSRKLCKTSFPELGQKFGGRDHTTVMSACRKMEALLVTEPQLSGVVQEIERHLLV
jgi:chromosomal replication initiator protein